MTADADSQPEAPNMRRIGIDMNRQNGRGAAQSAGADSGLGSAPQTSFPGCSPIQFLNVPRHAAVLFRHQSAFSKVPPTPHTDNHMGGQVSGPASLPPSDVLLTPSSPSGRFLA